MILQLGAYADSSLEWILEWIRVTTPYSNAVLMAVLPYISDVAKKLDLPVSNPVTQEQVIHCSIMPQRKLGVEIGIKGGWVFAFSRGHVETIQSGRSFTVLQDPDEIPRFFGPVRMSKAEGVEMARNTMRKLGIPLESVFAEQEPNVGEPNEFGTNTVPHYFVTWLDPRGGIRFGLKSTETQKKSSG